MRIKEEKEMEKLFTEMYDDVADQDEPVTEPDQISSWLMNSITEKVEVYHEFGKQVGFLTIDRGTFVVSDSKKAGDYPQNGYTKFTTNRVENLDESEGVLRISLK
jgi:hypothetical protein